MDNGLHKINQGIAPLVLLTLFQWIAIYRVDSVIQPSNNCGVSLKQHLQAFEITICINKVQRIQNAAAGLTCQQSRFCHITPLLFDLHWLPVKFRIEFKILLITFKALKGLAPTYTDSLISIK